MNERIPLIHISTRYNIRGDLGDLRELMASITRNGLLEPIGLQKKGEDEYVVMWGNRRLAAMKTIGYSHLVVGSQCVVYTKPMTEREFLILNATENLHRKDIEPTELGKLVDRMRKEFGMSMKDVAEALSMTEQHLYNATHLYKKVPEKWQRSVGYASGSKVADGRIAAGAMTKALSVPVKGVERELLFSAIRQQEIGSDEIAVIRGLVENGMKIGRAIKERKNFKVLTLKLVVQRGKAERLEKAGAKKIYPIVYEHLYTNKPLPDGLVYNWRTDIGDDG